MTRPLVLFITVLLVGACSFPSDDRPDVVRDTERYMETGIRAFYDQRYTEATEQFGKALNLYRSIDDARGTLLCHINLIEIALATGNLAAAEQHLERATTIVTTRDNNLQGYLPRLVLLGAEAALKQGDMASAIEQVTPLLPAMPEGAGDVPPSSNQLQLAALTLRTRVAFLQSDAEAEQWTQRFAAAIAAKGADSPYPPRLWRFQAQLATSRGDYPLAGERLDAALAYYQGRRNRPSIAATLTEMADLHIAQRQWPLAMERLRRALYIRAWNIDRIGTVEVLRRMATVHEDRGEDEAADAARHWADQLESGKAIDWSRLRDGNVDL